MITHRVHEFMDDLRRTWCGIDLAPGDPRPANDAVVDCMSCLVAEARLSADLKSDRIIDLETTGMRPWR